MKVNLIRQRKHGNRSAFSLLLRDGTQLRVSHPDNMAISPRRVFVIGRTGSVGSVAASQVVAINEERPKSKPVKNKTKRL